MKIRSSRSFYFGHLEQHHQVRYRRPKSSFLLHKKGRRDPYSLSLSLSLARAEKKAKLPRPMDKHRRSGLRKHGSIRTMLAFFYLLCGLRNHLIIPHFLLSSSKKKTDDLRTKGVSLT